MRLEFMKTDRFFFSISDLAIDYSIFYCSDFSRFGFESLASVISKGIPILGC